MKTPSGPTRTVSQISRGTPRPRPLPVLDLFKLAALTSPGALTSIARRLPSCPDCRMNEAVATISLFSVRHFPPDPTVTKDNAETQESCHSQHSLTGKAFRSTRWERWGSTQVTYGATPCLCGGSQQEQRTL